MKYNMVVTDEFLGDFMRMLCDGSQRKISSVSMDQRSGDEYRLTVLYFELCRDEWLEKSMSIRLKEDDSSSEE